MFYYLLKDINLYIMKYTPLRSDYEMKAKTTSKLQKDFNGLKLSVNEWVLFLNYQQRSTKNQLKVLEKRLRELELEKEVRNHKF